MERDHDFGGIKMSGHDLAKMIDFISDPEKQKALRERLGKTNMPKEKIDKGMKELNEYIELKKKEQEGGKLSEEQQRRLKELEKSEEFRVVAQEAGRLALDSGLKVDMKQEQLASAKDAELAGVKGNQSTLVRLEIQKEESRVAAYNHFSTATDIREEFTDASKVKVANTNVQENKPPQQTLTIASAAKIEASANNLM